MPILSEEFATGERKRAKSMVWSLNEEFEWPENTVRLHGYVVDAHASLYVSEVVYLMCTAEVLIKQNFSIQ